MNYVWCAVRDARLDDVIARATQPEGLLRDPRWMTEGDLDEAPAACFVVGKWTFAFVRDTSSAPGQLTGAGEVLELTWDDDNQWSSIVAYLDGRTRWSVYGAVDDDYVRVEGDEPPPPAIADLLGATEDCERVPLEIGRRLTGFAVDHGHRDDGGYEPPPIQVMRFDTELPELVEASEPAPKITARVRERSDALIVADLIVEQLGEEPSTDTWLDLRTAGQDNDRLLVATKDDHLFAVDMTTFPPIFTALGDVKCDGAALTPWQSTIIAIVDDNVNTLVRELGGARPQYVPLPFSTVGHGGLRRVPTGVVALPADWSKGHAVPHLITPRADGGRELTAIDLPRATEGMAESTAIGFGDESFVLTWQGEAYRWHRGVLTRLGALAADDAVDASITAPDGSILLRCGDGQLVRLKSDGTRERIDGFAPVFRIGPVVRDAVILIDHEAVKIWWPGDHQITCVQSEVFGLDGDPDTFYYDRQHDLLCALAEGLHAVPWRALAALPRTRLPAR